MAESAFLAVVDDYKAGIYDGEPDLIFSAAASEGYVLLPGADRPYVEAKNGAYEVSDLLLPFRLSVFKTLQSAREMGMSIYPDWFSYDFEERYFKFTQEDFCQSFIFAKDLKRHNGEFLVNGEVKTDDEIKDSIRRSLAIVRSDPGKMIYGVFSALKTMVKDDAPPKEHKDRLTIAALAEEIRARGYDLKYNTITAEMEIVGLSDTGRALSQDDLITILHDALSGDYKGVNFDILRMYTQYHARENMYNPVLQLLSATQWDGVDRLPELYTLIGVSDDRLSQVLIRKWLYQAVALLFNDPVNPFGADGCLVFNGAQGAGKTSLFRHLAMRDAWFAEGCTIDDHDKDTSRRVITTWIAELGEVESTLKSDIAKLKAFVSASVDKYRLAYGKSDIVRVRTTSLCATCNSNRYLIDPTGNRRWWSVPFNRMIPREDLMSFDALQLWAQIYAVVNPLEYKDKAACFRLTEEERNALAERNNIYEKPQKGQTEIEDILSMAKEKKYAFKKMTVTEFKRLWNDDLRMYSTQQIGTALRACGVDIKHLKSGSIAELPTPFKADEPFN